MNGRDKGCWYGSPLRADTPRFEVKEVCIGDFKVVGSNFFFLPMTDMVKGWGGKFMYAKFKVRSME